MTIKEKVENFLKENTNKSYIVGEILEKLSLEKTEVSKFIKELKNEGKNVLRCVYKII